MADDRPRRGRGRRPAAEVRKDILEAAAELLFDDGMAGFTIEKVANVVNSDMKLLPWASAMTSPSCFCLSIESPKRFTVGA